jgi:hypothetical protein
MMAFVLVDRMPTREPLVYAPKSLLPNHAFGIAVPTR